MSLPSLVLFMTGSLESYWQQVWIWGARYSADTFITNPVREGVVRTTNWLGFHATLAIAAVIAFWRRFSWRLALWMCVSFIAVCAGLRFFPRYYFQLLPVFIVLGTQRAHVTSAVNGACCPLPRADSRGAIRPTIRFH